MSSWINNKSTNLKRKFPTQVVNNIKQLQPQLQPQPSIIDNNKPIFDDNKLIFNMP